MELGRGDVTLLDVSLSHCPVIAICPMRLISDTEIHMGLAWEKPSA